MRYNMLFLVRNLIYFSALNLATPPFLFLLLLHSPSVLLPTHRQLMLNTETWCCFGLPSLHTSPSSFSPCLPGPLILILDANGILYTNFPDPIRLLIVYSTILCHYPGHLVHTALFSSYMLKSLYDPPCLQFVRSRTIIYWSCSFPNKH